MGPLLRDLRRIAGTRTTFHGAADDGFVQALLQGCSASVWLPRRTSDSSPSRPRPGKPVVAYGRGGACETVVDRVTGVLFEEQRVDSLRRAILACDELATSPGVIAENAERFYEGLCRRACSVSVDGPPSARRAAGGFMSVTIKSGRPRRRLLPPARGRGGPARPPGSNLAAKIRDRSDYSARSRGRIRVDVARGEDVSGDQPPLRAESVPGCVGC